MLRWVGVTAAACWLRLALLLRLPVAGSAGGHDSSSDGSGFRHAAVVSPLGFNSEALHELASHPVRPGARLLRSAKQLDPEPGVLGAGLHDEPLRKLLGKDADVVGRADDTGEWGFAPPGSTVLVNMNSYDGCANVMLTTGGNRSTLHSHLGNVETFSAHHKQSVLVGCFNLECNTPAEWSNAAMGGKEFTLYPYSAPIQMISVFALEDTTLTVKVNNVVNLTFDIFAGRLQSWGGDYVDQIVDLYSTGNILVSQVSEAQYMGKYLMPIPPAADVVYGGVSTKARVSVLGGEYATVKQVCSDGSSQERTGSKFTLEDDEEEYEGRSCKLVASGGAKIGVTSYDDGSNKDGISWLSSNLFQQVTPIPMDMKWLKVVSDEAAFCQLDKWDKHRMELDTSNTFEFDLQGTSGVFHYKLPETAALSVIQCSAPYMIFGDEMRTEAEIQLITSDNPVQMDPYIHVHKHNVLAGQSALPPFNQAALHKKKGKH
eukprot:TRINITY_DN14307_c0_g2_i1.p1 TRINITY_DN14307_c0_g2~~TRINITY_DN14307_c0_g2_i1.p1  ORF type:complete len:487 (+),score=109.70 TRINITY_DN14307_c0_g2_i1:188-1648(+)